MPRWQPELFFNQADLEDSEQSFGSPGVHSIHIKYTNIGGHRTRLFCRNINPLNQKDVLEIVVDVVMSCLYRFIIGNCASESRLIINSDKQITGWASVALAGFFDLSALNSSPDRNQLEWDLMREWAKAPEGLVKIPLVAWILGDNDLHHHNIGWCFKSVIQEGATGLTFAKIDHGFVVHEFPSFLDSFSERLRYSILQKKPSQITFNKLLSFPICEMQGDYGRYWPFSVTTQVFTRKVNRTTDRECFELSSLWEKYSKQFPPNNCLAIEKEVTLISLMSLLYDRNWKSLCKYLLQTIPPLCNQFDKMILNSLRYILINVVENRLRELNKIYLSARPGLGNILVDFKADRVLEFARKISAVTPFRTMHKSDADDLALAIGNIGVYTHAKLLSRSGRDMFLKPYCLPKNVSEYHAITNKFRSLYACYGAFPANMSLVESRSIYEFQESLVLKLKDSRSALTVALVALPLEIKKVLIRVLTSGDGFVIYLSLQQHNLIHIILRDTSEKIDPLDIRRLPEHRISSLKYLNNFVKQFIKVCAEGKNIVEQRLFVKSSVCVLAEADDPVLQPFVETILKELFT